MKHPNHFGRWLACVLLCLLLAGCSMPGEQVQVEELLRAPKLSGDYGALQTALNDWLGESAQLKYPIQGELLSPFVLQDLDGDGQQDAAVLYTTAQTANVCVAILQRDDAGSWQVRQSVEGLAETVENVSLAQLQDTDSCQLVVGYTAAQNDHYLAVYSYQKGTLSTILEQQYEQYLVENITGGSSQDLILMSTQEDGSVQIELLTADREGSFRQVAVNGLSADKFSGCASVAAGAGADGRHYLVLDGWTGISGNNLASVLLRFDDESQQMVPASQIASEELYNDSLRNIPSLVSRDLDGDATEDSFAALANELSDDTGSNTNGGLYKQVYKNKMVTGFNDWCFDESRKAGDTGIVENDGNYIGYHVMYFVGTDDPYWMVQVRNAMTNKAYSEWSANLVKDITATENSGMKYVG